jgi:hypothetical protein
VNSAESLQIIVKRGGFCRQLEQMWLAVEGLRLELNSRNQSRIYSITDIDRENELEGIILLIINKRKTKLLPEKL